MPEKQEINNILTKTDDFSQMNFLNSSTRLEQYEYSSSPRIFQPIKSYKYIYNEIEFSKCLITANKLDCSNNTISINELGKFLKENLKVNELKLGNCELNIYKIDRLLQAYGSSLVNLELLDLSNNASLYVGVSLMTNFFISTSYLENYALGRKISILQLSNCQIDEYIYKHLLEKLDVAYPNIIQLDLSNNKISDDAVFHTLHYISDKSLLKLQLLDLSDNLAKKDTICALQKLIVYNGYQCALNKNISSNDLNIMFENIFNDHKIDTIGDTEIVEG